MDDLPTLLPDHLIPLNDPQDEEDSGLVKHKHKHDVKEKYVENHSLAMAASASSSRSSRSSRHPEDIHSLLSASVQMMQESAAAAAAAKTKFAATNKKKNKASSKTLIKGKWIRDRNIKFPVKLYAILERAGEVGFENVIAWDKGMWHNQCVRGAFFSAFLSLTLLCLCFFSIRGTFLCRPRQVAAHPYPQQVRFFPLFLGKTCLSGSPISLMTCRQGWNLKGWDSLQRQFNHYGFKRSKNGTFFLGVHFILSTGRLFHFLHLLLIQLSLPNSAQTVDANNKVAFHIYHPVRIPKMRSCFSPSLSSLHFFS